MGENRIDMLEPSSTFSRRGYTPAAIELHRHYVEVRERLRPKLIVKALAKPIKETAIPPKEPIAVAVARVRISRHQIARKVIEITAAHFGFTTELLCGQRRKQPIVHARYIATHLISDLTGMSTPELGLKLGGRDHTTIMHSIDRACELLGQDVKFKDDYEDIKAKVGKADYNS